MRLLYWMVLNIWFILMGGPQLSTRKVLVGPLVDPGMAVQLSQLDHQQGPPRPAVDYWVIFMGSMVSEQSWFIN